LIHRKHLAFPQKMTSKAERNTPFSSSLVRSADPLSEAGPYRPPR
jgi:hypothetical protein